jgi:hypothetical protein
MGRKHEAKRKLSAETAYKTMGAFESKKEIYKQTSLIPRGSPFVR